MSTQEREIRQRLKSVRETKGMSQADLAGYMHARGFDFKQQTINKIEKGERKVSASELVALANCLSVPPSNLLGLGEERTPLLTSGARLGEAADNLQHAALAYGRAMLSFAQAADGIEQLSEGDARFAREALVEQTPGWYATADVLGSIEATLKLNRVAVTGEHAQAVIGALRAEHEHFHKADG